MKAHNRIWGTAAILVLAIIGVVAGLVAISSQEAKIQVRQKRAANIDAATAQALDVAKETMNKRLPDEISLDPTGGTRVVDAKVARQVLEKQTRAFNVYYEEASDLSSQRKRVESAVFELMQNEDIGTILTVVCAMMGLYAASSLQRCT